MPGLTAGATPRTSGRGAPTVTRTVVAALVIVAAVVLLLVAAAVNPFIVVSLGLVGVIVAFAVPAASLWNWFVLLLVLVAFFPIRRYSWNGPIPSSFDPYLVPLLIVVIGLTALLIGTSHRSYQPLQFGRLHGIFLLVMLLSVVVNSAYVLSGGFAGRSLKALITLTLLFSVFVVTRQIVTDRAKALDVLMILVWTGVVVGFFALVERVTQTNVFWKFDKVLPADLVVDRVQGGRAGGVRSYGSAQHPIALAVYMSLLLPMALFLSQHAPRPFTRANRGWLHGVAAVVILMGAGSAVSRTSVVGLAAAFLLVLVLRPYLAVTLAALTLPLLGLASVLQPKLVSETVFSLFNVSSLIESQKTSANLPGAGRLADVGPVFSQFGEHPLFGVGFGTRIVIGDFANASILDNQYFETMLDAGALGLLALLFLTFVPVIRLALLSARRDLGRADRDLALALACSAVIFAVSSYFLDAFNFQQMFFVYLVLMGVGAWLLTEAGPRPRHDLAARDDDDVPRRGQRQRAG